MPSEASAIGEEWCGCVVGVAPGRRGVAIVVPPRKQVRMRRRNPLQPYAESQWPAGLVILVLDDLYVPNPLEYKSASVPAKISLTSQEGLILVGSNG